MKPVLGFIEECDFDCVRDLLNLILGIEISFNSEKILDATFDSIDSCNNILVPVPYSLDE